MVSVHCKILIGFWVTLRVKSLKIKSVLTAIQTDFDSNTNSDAEEMNNVSKTKMLPENGVT